MSKVKVTVQGQIRKYHLGRRRRRSRLHVHGHTHFSLVILVIDHRREQYRVHVLLNVKGQFLMTRVDGNDSLILSYLPTKHLYSV